jgi:quinol monooxygenase YgiN
MRKLILIGMTLFSLHTKAQSGQAKTPLVRVARLVVDSAQLEAYQRALSEEIQTAVKVEPGILALYAVAEKDHLTHITVFEMYVDENAYQQHLRTPHFKKYKAETKDMVRSLELSEMVPFGGTVFPAVK